MQDQKSKSLSQLHFQVGHLSLEIGNWALEIRNLTFPLAGGFDTICC
jgi:hypothetical protein